MPATNPKRRIFSTNDYKAKLLDDIKGFKKEVALVINDFSDEEVFESFFSNVLAIRDMSARFNEKYAPQPGDKVLILSTCFAGNNTRRFLVMATLLD